MLRKVSIIGAYETKWGVLKDVPLIEMIAEAAFGAINNAGIEKQAIQCIYLGNAFGEILNRQACLGSVAADQIGLPEIPGIRFECACAAGTAALREAFLNIASGIYDIVLVIGAEKMNTAPTPEILAAIATSFNADDQRTGLVAPALFALYANAHMHEYGTTKKQLAHVAYKNYQNGLLNPDAHWKKPVTMEDILSSPIIADPLGRHDCSLITDGAAALVLCAEDAAKHFNSRPVTVKASAIAGETCRAAGRESYTSFKSTTRAAEQAYKMAGVRPEDISGAETHDCFTITEIINIEDLGFFKKGEGAAATEAGCTAINGTMPVNPSGGLKAKGHAVGATGVGQVVEAVMQLRGEAGSRQIKNNDLFLTHILGGAPSVSLVHIFERGY